MTGGPLVDFSAMQMPDWLWLYERDLTSLAKFMCNYIMAVLKRYRKRVRRWHLTSASNSARPETGRISASASSAGATGAVGWMTVARCVSQ